MSVKLETRKFIVVAGRQNNVF